MFLETLLINGGFLDGSSGKEPTCNAGDTREAGSIPGWGRSPGVGKGKPLKYSCLENPMDKGTWQAIVYGVERLNTHRHMCVCN